MVEDPGSNGMIIGGDLLKFLGMDICFLDKTVTWGNVSMPFKDVDAQSEDAYYIAEDKNLSDMSNRIKRILDAKYNPADLDEVIQEQTELSKSEKAKLRELLERCKELFDGTLGKRTASGSQVEL